MFLESGGDFEAVKLKAKKWFESKKEVGNMDRRVTKKQLKELYHWDDARTSDCIAQYNCGTHVDLIQNLSFHS